MGTCNGVLSSCALAGYALESRYVDFFLLFTAIVGCTDHMPARCHMGKSAVYDTVTKLGWSVNIKHHGIKTVIESLLAEDWEELESHGDANSNGDMSAVKKKEVPVAKPEEDCVVSPANSPCGISV
jgi:lipase ATG15